MSLRDINFQRDYRSGYDDIIADFFQPSLANARQYWRAVGYFSSSAFESFGKPLGTFVRNGGKIRLVTSVELSRRDLEAIEAGAKKQDICIKRVQHIVDTEFADGVGSGTTRLLRLLAMDRLTIRVAVPKQGTGIYHEKIGLFFDERDYVSFTGSSNESRNAFENNRECLDVFPSWQSPIRSARKKSHFEDLWAGTDRGVHVFSIPDAIRRRLIRICADPTERTGGSGRDKNVNHNKWRHQDHALEQFIAAERGILNMATGTGKTRTALNITRNLFETGRIDTAIVCTEGNDLLDQWYNDVLRIRNELGTTVFRHYRSSHGIQDYLLHPKERILLVSRNALPMALRGLRDGAGERVLMIHDEVHGLGSPGNRRHLRGLSDRIRFRLGLSATPEREYDNAGNKFLEEHVGPEIVRFEVSDAIRRGILAPFDYFPLGYTLTSDDRKRIQHVYRIKAARAAEGNPMTDQELWIEIAKVYKTSEAKLPIFDEFIRDNQNLLRRCIVFVETQKYGDAVLDIIHKYRSDFHTYYSGEDSATLHRFARGHLECILTCHRLSEGIDIHSVQSVILFSSARAKLETIQRIGRCLRIDPNQPDKISAIVDFIRQTPNGGDLNTDNARQEWLRELSAIRHEEEEYRAN